MLLLVYGIVVETGHCGLCQRIIDQTYAEHAAFIQGNPNKPTIELLDPSQNTWILAIPSNQSVEIQICTQSSTDLVATVVESVTLSASSQPKIEVIKLADNLSTSPQDAMVSVSTATKRIVHKVSLKDHLYVDRENVAFSSIDLLDFFRDNRKNQLLGTYDSGIDPQRAVFDRTVVVLELRAVDGNYRETVYGVAVRSMAR